MPIYNCHLCCKIYTNHTQYEDHIKVCTEKSNFEKGKMTLNQVSRLILELSEKVNILEQERVNDKIRINNLEALVKKQNKESKRNIFKTLNLIQPHIGFVEWIKTINIKEEHFDTLFKYSLKDAIIDIMKDAFVNKTSIPIQALANALKNDIYIYDKDESEIYTWKKIGNNDFPLFVNAIHKLIKHKYFINDAECVEDIETKYEKDVKILGNLTQNEISEIKKRCFDRLRC